MYGQQPLGLTGQRTNFSIIGTYNKVKPLMCASLDKQLLWSLLLNIQVNQLKFFNRERQSQAIFGTQAYYYNFGVILCKNKIARWKIQATISTNQDGSPLPAQQLLSGHKCPWTTANRMQVSIGQSLESNEAKDKADQLNSGQCQSETT